MWELLARVMSFREIRMLQRLAENFGKLIKLPFSGSPLTIFTRFTAVVAVMFELLGALIFSEPQTPRGQSIDMSEWTLYWADEFDGDTLDEMKWTYPWQNYVRRGGIWHKNQISVSDGNLHIRTEYKTSEVGTGWHSGEISTEGLFETKYGYFECRCICPGVNGAWAAFWMLSQGMFAEPTGSAANGCEIDLFESGFHGNKKMYNAVNQATGFDGYTPGVSSGVVLGHYLGENIYTQYNTFGLEWNEDEIIFYINGIETDRLGGKWVPQVEMYLLLSVEVKGENGNAGLGGEDVPFSDDLGRIESNDPSIFPVDFLVDYVRVYKK